MLGKSQPLFKYFITPQADLRLFCAEAKSLKHINDAPTTTITAHDTKEPLNERNFCAKRTFIWCLVMKITHD